MGKSARKMFSTIYENDIIDLDTLHELENIIPLKTNRAIKKAEKANEKVRKIGDSGKTVIDTKPVQATCNKCSKEIIGDLVGDIYLPVSDKVMPLITYTCVACGHVGRRSVMSLALPLGEYEKKFFN